MPGGGGGFMQDMNTSLKNNRNYVKERRKKSNKLKEEYAGLHYKKNKLQFIKPTKEVLGRIKIKNQQYLKKYRLANIVIIVFIIVAVSMGLFLMRV